MGRTGRSLRVFGTVVLGAVALAAVACDGTEKARLAAATDQAADPPAFEHLALRMHLDEQAGDTELHVEAIADKSLRRLTVYDPYGRLLFTHEVGQGTPSGVDEVIVQAPEKDGHSYPEGTYRIEAETVDGDRMVASPTLSFDLLPAPKTQPGIPDPVHPDEVKVAWDPVPGAAGYVVEIEHEETKILIATLPPTVECFAIPAGVLAENAAFEVVLQVVSASGNRTEIEGAFTTGSR